MRPALGLTLALLAAALSTGTAAHSDGWCADAVDFAMGTAQNLELGYPREVMANSLDRNPGYYQRMFFELSIDDMKQLVASVYEHQWSRFQAAQGITESCEPE